MRSERKQHLRDIGEVLLITVSLVVLFIALFTYHPAQPARPPATCGSDTTSPAYGEPHMPAGMIAKENR